MTATPSLHESEIQRAERAAPLGMTLLGRWIPPANRENSPGYRVYRMSCGHEDAYTDAHVQRMAHRAAATPTKPIAPEKRAMQLRPPCRECAGQPALLPTGYVLLPLRRPPAPAQPTTSQDATQLVAQLAEHTKRLDEGDAAFAQLAEIVAAQLAELRSELATIRAHVGMPSSSSTN